MEKVTGIVLTTIKYNDKKNIVILYTRELGRISVMVSSGAGKGARLLRARLMPLAMIKAEVKSLTKGEIHHLGECVPARVWHSLYFDPSRSAIVMFLAEFLNAMLRESNPDPELWNFLTGWIELLDNDSRVPANAHIAILTGLLPYMGISPDTDCAGRPDSMWFDMREGRLTPEAPLHHDSLPPAEAKILPLIMRMSSLNFHKYRFTAQQRRRILDALVHYYSVHYPGVSNLKSLQILAETFD